MEDSDVHRFMSSLNDVKENVERRLEIFLNEKAGQAAQISPSAEEMIRVLNDFTLRGGKRLRAAITIFGYRCFCDREDDAVWVAAMSMELVQSFLLIHDDMIDLDATRRGGSTVHQRYRELHREKNFHGDPSHFGDSMAVLCGDLAMAMANEILGSAPLEGTVRSKALVALNRMLCRVIHGETMDILSGLEAGITEEEILKIYHLKSSAYTVEGPLHIGAILGGAGAEDLEHASRYAIPVGKAFQIRDDILGLFGDEEKLGKPIGSDIREGKKTFLMLKALEKGSRAQQACIKETLGKSDIETEDMEMIRQIIVETGALAYARNLARRLCREAQSVLSGSDWRREGKAFLAGVVAYVLEREY